MKEILIKITCDGSGNATVKGEHSIFGKLYAIEYQPISLATGATCTITCLHTVEAPKPLFTKANMGTSHVWFYPRDLVHAVADGSALTGSSGGDRACPIVAGTPQVVIASGGTSTTGNVILYYED